MPRSGGSLEPLSRRLLKVVAVLSVLLIGVIANSVLHGGENTELNPVAAAAERMENCPGFYFSVYVVYSSPALPGPLRARGRGAYNGDTKRTRMTLSVVSPIDGRSLRFVQVNDDTHTYTKNSADSAKLPPDREWVRTEKDEDDGNGGLDSGKAMQMLSDSGNVRVVGHQSVNGKMTRRYRANISLPKLIELLREEGEDDDADAYENLEGIAPTGVSSEAWVDRKNIVRRMRFVMPTPGKDGDPPMTMDIRMDLFKFGSRPDIQLPDPDTVVDGPLDSSAAPQQRPPGHPAASRRTFETRPTGEWVATGHVRSAERRIGLSAGEVLHRRWRFETRCTDGACQTYFLRTSSTGVQSSPLRFRPHNYLAEFGNLGTTCEVRPGYFRSFSVTFSIWWTKHHSQLVAEEMGGINGDPECHAGERIRWTAHRLSGDRTVPARS